MNLEPFVVQLGDDDPKPHLRIDVSGYEYPDVEEPAGMDVLVCQVHAVAPPVRATFDLGIRIWELIDLRDYLAHINSGNGPPATFSIAGGMIGLSFAPSRRGPVLCAVMLKSIDASHVRLEYMITLEPDAITRALTDLAVLDRAE